MESKNPHVVVILVDGMRPDGLTACGHPFVETMLKDWAYTLNARTVMPSVTLPCHMSLFHSVDPERHGILTNTYVPQVRPVKGLVDALSDQGYSTEFFITWEELRDLSRPDSLNNLTFINQHKHTDCDTKITDAAIAGILERKPDFTFLYLGETDELGGHDTGWMSETYEKVVANAVRNIQRVSEALPEDEFSIILLADHGGHGRSHGSELPEDMTIPVLARGPRFAPGETLNDVSIKDVAVTVADLLGMRALPHEWEGKSFAN